MEGNTVVDGEIVQPESLTPVKTTGKPMTMDFPDAVRELIKGKKITRVSWGNLDYALLKDGWLTIFTKGSFHTWSVNDGDLEGQDWIIVQDKN